MARRNRHGDPRVAVAYLRVSTEEQRNGADAQRGDVTRWAAQADARVAGWHVDRGVSGAAPLAQRPALLAALDDVRRAGAGVLVVQKRDRLARDVVTAAVIERAAASAGARIVSAQGEGTDADDPAALLQRGIVDLFAQHERAVIRARTRAALRAKRARGERAGTVPFGFVADAAGRLTPCPAEQAVIARARALRAAGASLRRVVARLAAAGFVSRAGRPLGLTQVARLLRAARANQQ